MAMLSKEAADNQHGKDSVVLEEHVELLSDSKGIMLSFLNVSKFKRSSTATNHLFIVLNTIKE